MEPKLDLPEMPRFDSNFDCQMSPERCGVIQRGIDAMKMHANPQCKLLGDRAQDRYDAASGEGFRDQSPWNGLQMSVFTTPRDGYTNVHPQFWNNEFINSDQATGALLAHEEMHHQGGDEAEAVKAQDACLNSQA